MKLAKKALSTALTATMLASLLATAGAGSVFAATYGTAFPYSTTATTAVADGLDHIILDFAASTANDASVLNITVSGGSFIAGHGTNFVASATQTYPRTTFLYTNVANVTLAVDDDLWLGASAAGTATVTISYYDISLAKTVVDSITSFTFTAGSSTVVSTNNSKTTINGGSTAAISPLNTTRDLTTVVKDTNNDPITAGATVTWTLSGPAYFDPAGALSGKGTVSENGPALNGTITSDKIFSTGVAGVVTIKTVVKYLNVSYDLADKTLTLVGQVAKVEVVNNTYSIDKTDIAGTGSGNWALEVAVSDAAGTAITSFGATLVLSAGTYTPSGIFAVVVGNPGTLGADTSVTPAYDATDKAYDVNVACLTTGTGTVTIKAKTTIDGTAKTVESAPITFVCANAPSADHYGTLDISADATTVAPNGVVNVLVTVKDDNGLPAPDGTEVTAVTNGVGNVVSTAGKGTKGTVNGVSKFLYLAPSNAGSATVTAFSVSPYSTPRYKSVTLTIGAAAATAGTNASSLGATKTGTYTTATKIAALGKYQTFKISYGAGAAGQVVGIRVATKNSAGVWGPYARLTGRVADSAGNAYFWVYKSSAAWISVQGDLAGNLSNAVHGRWR